MDISTIDSFRLQTASPPPRQPGGAAPPIISLPLGDEMSKDQGAPDSWERYVLIVTLNEKTDEHPTGRFQAKVRAATIQDACRAIIHRQMSKGEPPRKITQSTKKAT